MTEANFIALHFPAGQANIAGTIHLNVNEPGIITSVIVHIDAFSINGNEIDTDIENVLEQITSIKFNFPTDLNGNTLYELNILTRAYYPAQNPFFYYTLEPAFIPDINDATQYFVSLQQITLTPFLLDLQFGFSDFNPLFSNASLNRKSYRLMISDRNNETVTPSNIDALLALTAEKAAVQDSLYHDTGWSSARYGGTVTDASSNAGISPTLTGRSFTGETFSKDASSDYICKLDNRVNQELFHTSEDPLPVYSIDTTFELTLSQDFIGGAVPQTIMRYSSITPANHGLKVGDVLVGPTGERLKVLDINESAQEVEVRRNVYSEFGFYGSPSYSAGAVFNVVARFDIFRFENSGQNRIQLVNNSRIYVNENNAIVNTDDYGQITSSSFCPRFNIDISDND